MRSRVEQIDPEQDVLVIGGGINGAAVARDAALRGFRVTLLEKDDFGAGASSRTSKLVHGGLRYLEHGALRLVWEACHERRRLLRLAPHLVRPLPFVFPVYAGSRIPAWQMRLGMWLYDGLAGFANLHRHRVLRLGTAGDWLAPLRRAGLRAAALYWDACMDDARLVLANVLGAREAGATTLNDVRVERLLIREGRVCGAQIVEQASGERAELYAPCVVACTGAWTNSLLAQLPERPRAVSPTRGAHVLVRRLCEHAFTLAARSDGRIFFVLPWLGLTLIGTTDVPDETDPDRTVPTEEEVEYLLAEANRFFPEAHLDRADVLAAFAGLRPLRLGDGDRAARRREHALLEPAPGLVCVVGGKYTTYRLVAAEVVQRLEQRLGRRRPCSTHVHPLPGGDLAWSAPEHWQEGPAFRAAVARAATGCGLAAEEVAYLLRVHGSRAELVFALARSDPALRERVCPHLPHVRAEVVHAIRAEMALHLDDWYLRRSRTAYQPCHGAEALDEVADLFAAELGWSRSERERECERGRRAIESVTLTRSSPASSRSA